jgi:hypothetical protein
MSVDNFSYLFTILFFAGTAVLIEWLLAAKKLKRYSSAFTKMILLGIIFALVGESTAIIWKVYYFSPDKTFDIYIYQTALETFLYITLVVIAVASATFMWAEKEEAGIPLVRSTWKSILDKFRQKP